MKKENSKKNFDQWNELKKQVGAKDDYHPEFQERQIRWCRLGVNIGVEQNGTGIEFSRPVLILRGFSRQTCLVVPLTTSLRKNKYRIPIGEINGKNATVILSQIRTVDSKRLDQRIQMLGKSVFDIIVKAVRDLL